MRLYVWFRSHILPYCVLAPALRDRSLYTHTVTVHPHHHYTPTPSLSLEDMRWSQDAVRENVRCGGWVVQAMLQKMM